MGAVGGSIESLSIDGRTFPVAADAEANVKLGGYEKEVQPNGDGSSRPVKSRVAWSISGVSVQVDHDRGDQEFLQGIANQNGNVNVVITYANGISYQGRGTITGELPYNTQNATIELELAGPQKLTQQ